MKPFVFAIMASGRAATRLGAATETAAGRKEVEYDLVEAKPVGVEKTARQTGRD